MYGADHHAPTKPARVPDLIRRFLREENMTPSQLASILNVAETTVHRWLKGEARPTGTAASILWTLIAVGGVYLGAGAPGILARAGLAAKVLRGTSMGVGALTSGLAIYRLLKKRIEREEVNEEIDKALQAEIENLEAKERQQEKVEALKRKLAEEEQKLLELDGDLTDSVTTVEQSGHEAQ